MAPRPLKQMAEYSINATVTGVLEHVNYLDTWKDHPDVLYARPLVQVRGAGVESGSAPGWVARRGRTPA